MSSSVKSTFPILASTTLACVMPIGRWVTLKQALSPSLSRSDGVPPQAIHGVKRDRFNRQSAVMSNSDPQPLPADHAYNVPTQAMSCRVIS